MASKKHYPVVRQFDLGESAGPFSGRTQVIVDTAACLSQANRRLYRYGRVYPVKIDAHPDNVAGVIEVYALRDDWVVQKAFQMAYQTYRDNTSEERAKMSKSQIARWEDFRIHHGQTASSTAEWGPVFYETNGSVAARLVSQGVHIESSVVDESGTTFQFTWGGIVGNQYNVLEEYDLAGNVQVSPNSLVTGAAGPYDGLDSDVQGDTFTDLEATGNNPPYDANGVNATAPWIRVGTLQTNSPNSQKLSTGFFNAPCGLVMLKWSAGDINEQVSMTVKPGDYKGVHAPSMLE